MLPHILRSVTSASCLRHWAEQRHRTAQLRPRTCERTSIASNDASNLSITAEILLTSIEASTWQSMTVGAHAHTFCAYVAAMPAAATTFHTDRFPSRPALAYDPHDPSRRASPCPFRSRPNPSAWSPPSSGSPTPSAMPPGTSTRTCQDVRTEGTRARVHSYYTLRVICDRCGGGWSVPRPGDWRGAGSCCPYSLF